MKRYIKSATSMYPGYKLCDTWGAPQAGCDVEYFDTYDELVEYIEETDGLQERIDIGEAWIEDISSDYTDEVEYARNQRYLRAGRTIKASDDDLPKGYYDDYFGQSAYEEYGDLVSRKCHGMIISKRASDGEEPGGLIYEADRLGIDDFFELLRCLEGMCYNGTAVEISDYQYKVL